MTERFHVITGGPGSGKSSVIAALSAQGFAHMPETGRAIIQKQVSTEGKALPWADREAFATLMLAREMRSYRDAAVLSGSVIFDRGIPDVIGYRRLCGLTVPDDVIRAARLRRYAKQVFIAPHWPQIFVQDAERKQTTGEAEATYHAMADIYLELGYELISLPFAPVAERARFIRDHIRKAGSREGSAQ